MNMFAGITRIGIKSFVESVRLQTLNRQGLQQLQVDVHFLRPQLRRLCPLQYLIFRNLTWGLRYAKVYMMCCLRRASAPYPVKRQV